MERGGEGGRDGKRERGGEGWRVRNGEREEWREEGMERGVEGGRDGDSRKGRYWLERKARNTAAGQTCMIYRRFMNLPRSQSQVFWFNKFFILTITLKQSRYHKHCISLCIQLHFGRYSL